MLSNSAKSVKDACGPLQLFTPDFTLYFFHMKHVKIRENSWLARVAALKLGANSVALTLGNTIHLYRASRQEFLKNNRWLRHELAHVQQFRKYGFLSFICMYLAETLKNGYFNNKYEVEARAAETDL